MPSSLLCAFMMGRRISRVKSTVTQLFRNGREVARRSPQGLFGDPCRRGAQGRGPIRASIVTDPNRAIAILGHSRRTDFDAYQEVTCRLYLLDVDYRRMGAAAIGLVRVADGIADLYYEGHLNGWDMLAGALIAREAGAHVYLPPVDISLRDGGPVLARGQRHDEPIGLPVSGPDISGS